MPKNPNSIAKEIARELRGGNRLKVNDKNFCKHGNYKRSNDCAECKTPKIREDKCADAEEAKKELPTMTDEQLRTADFVVREELNQRRRLLAAIRKERMKRVK